MRNANRKTSRTQGVLPVIFVASANQATTESIIPFLTDKIVGVALRLFGSEIPKLIQLALPPQHRLLTPQSSSLSSLLSSSSSSLWLSPCGPLLFHLRDNKKQSPACLLAHPPARPPACLLLIRANNLQSAPPANGTCCGGAPAAAVCPTMQANAFSLFVNLMLCHLHTH